MQFIRLNDKKVICIRKSKNIFDRSRSQCLYSFFLASTSFAKSIDRPIQRRCNDVSILDGKCHFMPTVITNKKRIWSVYAVHSWYALSIIRALMIRIFSIRNFRPCASYRFLLSKCIMLLPMYMSMQMRIRRFFICNSATAEATVTKFDGCGFCVKVNSETFHVDPFVLEASFKDSRSFQTPWTTQLGKTRIFPGKI